MAYKLILKPEYSDRVFGFNNSAAPLGQRNDLHLLYADAKYHNVKDILEMFEEIPEADILEIKGEAFLQKQTEKLEATDIVSPIEIQPKIETVVENSIPEEEQKKLND